MKIKQVTFGLTLTQSLPAYCNIKPSFSLSAEIDEGEDFALVRAKLQKEVEEFLFEYVDQALESEGKAPRYYSGPTYQIATDHTTWVILPDTIRLPGSFYHSVRGGDSRGLRLENALEKAKRIAGKDKVIDCSDGNLSKLPPGPKDDTDEDYQLVVPGDEDSIPF